MSLLGGKKGNKLVKSSNYIGNISRTKVPLHFEFRTTFSAGKLIPFFCDEILPGQTYSVNMGELIRSITPLGPVMDKSFLDLFFFFVPKRLLWDHWEEFIAGYNKEAWAQDIEYTVPKIKLKCKVDDNKTHDGSAYLHSFLDYLPGACDVVTFEKDIQYQGSDAEVVAALQPEVDNLMAIDALYPRAYVKIWNDWFRDENWQDEYTLYTGDNDQYADEFAFDLLSADALPSMAKYHNRFTSVLPSPVKGPDVLIPMDNLSVGYDNTSSTFTSLIPNDIGYTDDAGEVDGAIFAISADSSDTPIRNAKIYAKNVSNTIRMLRLATQTELLLARDARGGTRYVESLLSHFAVHNGDARLQRSEYLGSRQVPLQVIQVTNTSQADSNALGNVGGQSVTKDNYHFFTKSFSEHGILFCVGGVRTAISYSSGVRKMYQRFTRFDHIWPEFKHIGDVPLYTRELDINANLVGAENTVFGYTPYASELREGYNFNNGLFRYKAPGNLAYLTYQEQYNDDSSPIASDEWIQQPSYIVSNTLVTQTGPQYYGLFEIYAESVIPLDPTSDPGLMDHF